MKTLKKLRSLVLAVLTTLVFWLTFSLESQAQSSIPSLYFANPQLEFGVWGNVSSTYRFSNVADGVDALVTIRGASNAELVNLDLDNTGSFEAFQPQVKISNQNANGATAFMDFLIEFVESGTDKSVTLPEWTAAAIDIDGDNYRLREAVSLYNTSNYITELTTALNINHLGDEATFTAGTVFTNDGVDTSATDHMVFAYYSNRSSFVYRTRVIDDGAFDGPSNAEGRMFSLNFNPDLIDNFDNPDAFPVEWLGFNARLNANRVELEWSTAIEVNNDYFEVERSIDGMVFESLGKVKGAGFSSEQKDYHYIDQRPAIGPNFYRIKQVDFDGNLSYSSTVELNVSKDDLLQLRAYPNPATDFLTVETGGIAISQIKLVDTNGRIVLSQNNTTLETNLTLRTSDLAAGVYILQVRDQAAHVYNKKIVLR